jgi:multicomponent Na+:H+ antiporter subunit D
MIAQIPALQVVLPLIGAPLCVVFRRGALPWFIALAMSWLALAMAATLLSEVADGTVISYAIGGWLAPLGIEYVVDPLNAFMMVIVAATGSIVLPFAYRSVEREIPAEKHFLFYGGYLLMFTGLLGMAITGDAFNVFVFIEISSLSSYAMIAMGRDRRALSAAFTYLVMGTVGATFFLIGVGLIYAVTGTLNMADLAQRLPPLYESRAVLAAFAFISAGLLLKLALFPLHLWLPNAYTYAPSVVTAFLAATATKVAIYLLLRFGYTVFGAEFVFDIVPASEVLLALAIAGTVVASLVAIFQADVKRLLAYSSVAQIGYIILGVSYANVTGMTASLVHIFNHAVTKGALFLVMGCVAFALGNCRVDNFAGLGKRMPLTMAAFVIGGLSLIGVPLTAGFVSKWYLVLGAIERGWWPVAVLVLGTSLLAVAYVWRMVEMAYFRDPPADAPEVRDPPLSLLAPMWILTAACVYFGIETSLPVGFAEQAAQFLMGAN